MRILYLDDFLSRPQTLAFWSLCGIYKQVPFITTIRSLFMKAPIVSPVGIGRTNWWNNCLIAPASNLCRGWVMADLQRIRQFLPIFTYASLRPSIRFFSTSRIESFDHRLIAMTRHTTSCAGSWRWRFSSTFVFAIEEAIADTVIAISMALNILVLWILGETNEHYLRCTVLYFISIFVYNS